MVWAGRGRGGDGGSNSQGQEKKSALRRVSRRRVRNQGIVRWRARQAGRQWRRGDYPDQADGGGKRGAAKVVGLRARIGGRARIVKLIDRSAPLFVRRDMN